MKEFDAVKSQFPSIEEIKRYERILEKYGEKRLSSVKALSEIKELFENPSDLFFLYSFMNAQKKAVSIEKFIYSKLGGYSVKSNDDRGDAHINGKFVEIKTSTTNQGDNLNIRQIRLYQTVDLYICSYIFERELSKSKVYCLTSDQMKEEVDLIGGFTHGTKQANAVRTNPEYSVTINVFNENRETTRRWNQKYWYNTLYQILQT